MRRAVWAWAVAMEILLTGGLAAGAQTPQQSSATSPVAAPMAASAPATPAETISGGRLHGMVKSGNIPLPGVTVTAQNTLTGKKYSTTSDITGDLVHDPSAKRALRDPHRVCGVCARRAGSAVERRQPRPDGELSVMLASRAAAQAEQQASANTAQGEAARRSSATGRQWRARA